MTVEQNLNFYSQLKGIKKECLYGICQAIMKTLDLTQFQNYLCKNLSGGNKRKLSVGISIICHPNVIFMDEPSTGMDPYTRRLLLNLLHRSYLKNEDISNKKEEYKQRAIILTTHSIEEVEALCDKIGILVDGAIEKNTKGTINDVVQKNSKGIELNVEFKKVTYKQLFKTYGNILNESITNLEDIKNLLGYIKKGKYYDYIKEKSLGNDILVLIKKNKRINKSSVLLWATYLDYLFALVKVIKKYFFSVEFINCKLNNFILIINANKHNKCDSYIFGILEENMKKLSIEEYSYSLTTLETVFLKFCEHSYKKSKIGRASCRERV